MKVLMINGSPHSKGNTFIALQEMEKIFKQEGMETEIVHVGNKDIRGCIACYSCMEKGKCVFDDLVNEAAPKFEACDGLVIGSPVYYASANATLIAFLDRLFLQTGVQSVQQTPFGVEAAVRENANGTYLFLLNHTTEKKTVVLEGDYEDLLEGCSCNCHDEIVLEKKGVRLLRRIHK